MKTLSGTMKIFLVLGLGVATVITLRALEPSPSPSDKPDPPMPPLSNENFVLRIKERHPLRTSSLAGEADFIVFFCKGPYDQTKENKIHFRHLDVHIPDHNLPQDCNAARAAVSPGAQLNIKTDKVTVSKAAQSIADGELTSITPHVTQQVAAKTIVDIQNVLDKLAP